MASFLLLSLCSKAARADLWLACSHQQTHLKGEPKTVFVGVNVDGVSIFKTSDKVCTQRLPYPFGRLRALRLLET